MEIEILLRFSSNQEVPLKVCHLIINQYIGQAIDSFPDKRQYNWNAAGQPSQKTNRSENRAISHMGVRLPETKTLRELDVRSGYVFNVDVDTTNQIAALRQKASTIPKNAKFSRGWVIEQICRLAECEIATPLDLAELLLGDPTTIHRVAGEADKEEVLEVFNLEEAITCLALKDSVSQYPVPDQVFKNIEALEAAGYDKTNEAYCRLGAEFIMIPALGQARRNLNVDVKTGSPKKLKAPKKQSRDPESPRRDLKMFREYDLRTAINQSPVNDIYSQAARTGQRGIRAAGSPTLFWFV